MATVLEQVQEKYEMVGKLREGGMGAIYLVRHKLLGEYRVVKVLRSQLEADQEFAKRFVREAQTLIRLRHSHIAQLYDFFADETGNAAMVMEYIAGIDLRELLRRHGPPSLGLAVEIATQALEAIGFLHRRQMVHRDISPDNLMLSQDEDGKPLVKLIDLGIVKALEAEGTGLTSTGMFIGKVRYASPEQFKGAEAATLDQRSDLYSFGVVLYELLTGRLPVVGDTASALIAAHLYHPPLGFEVTDPQGRVPAELRQLVMDLLAKDPQSRPARAEAVQARLRSLQARYPFAGEELQRLLPPPEERLATIKVAGTPPPSALEQQPLPTAPTAVTPATTATAPAAPPTVAPAPLPQPEAAASARRRGLWLSGLLLAGALAAGGFYLWQQRAKSPVPVPQAEGVLVLHAIPWGQVWRITNAQGEALPLPTDLVTPVRLSLPAGNYTVALKDPASGAVTTVPIEVHAGGTTRTVVPLRPVDPEAFLKQLGWR